MIKIKYHLLIAVGVDNKAYILTYLGEVMLPVNCLKLSIRGFLISIIDRLTYQSCNVLYNNDTHYIIRP